MHVRHNPGAISVEQLVLDGLGSRGTLVQESLTSVGGGPAKCPTLERLPRPPLPGKPRLPPARVASFCVKAVASFC